MKKYFLTTALMGMFIAPAFGADKIITSANTCTVDVLGVSDNNATANTIATWDLIDYTLDPGEYLNVTDTSVTETTCPAGSYCVGGGFTVETASNSIAQCPTEYPNSATGAGAQNQCYTACTVATANIAHATAVSGNDYYGTGVDTCGATACETGYHVDGGGIEIVEKTPVVPLDYKTLGLALGSVYIDINGDIYSNSTISSIPENTVVAPNTYAVAFNDGVVYGSASCQDVVDPAIEYLLENEGYVSILEMTKEEFRTGAIAKFDPVKADAINGQLDYDMFAYAGFDLTAPEGYTLEEYLAELNLKYVNVFSDYYDANYSTSDIGRYCYCRIDRFLPVGNTKELEVVAPWVFRMEYSDNNPCTTGQHGCAKYCAEGLSLTVYRSAMFDAVDVIQTAGICAANTINIDWNPDNNGAHTINQCTYDGAITLPADPVKPGYTFTGWKLVE